MLTTIGTIIQVTPWDDISVLRDELNSDSIDDRASFCFRIEEQLLEAEKAYGICGKVISPKSRFIGLTCSVIPRVASQDWFKFQRCPAVFKIGPDKARRNREFAYSHPDGTRVNGFPSYSAVCGIEQTERETDHEETGTLKP